MRVPPLLGLPERVSLDADDGLVVGRRDDIGVGQSQAGNEVVVFLGKKMMLP